MFHMLTCFDLKPGIEIGAFRAAYLGFVEYMRSIDLVECTGPIGQRQRDTRMDTDGERDHEYFVIMSFRDRARSMPHMPNSPPTRSLRTLGTRRSIRRSRTRYSSAGKTWSNADSQSSGIGAKRKSHAHAIPSPHRF
jgi:hypothetical protein